MLLSIFESFGRTVWDQIFVDRWPKVEKSVAGVESDIGICLHQHLRINFTKCFKIFCPRQAEELLLYLIVLSLIRRGEEGWTLDDGCVEYGGEVVRGCDVVWNGRCSCTLAHDGYSVIELIRLQACLND